MASFPDATIARPCISTDDSEWLPELVALELAVTAMLEAKRKTLREDPDREAVLWIRYADRFALLRRRFAAAVM